MSLKKVLLVLFFSFSTVSLSLGGTTKVSVLQDHEKGPLFTQTLHAIRNGYLDGMRHAMSQLSGGLFSAIGQSARRLKLLTDTYLYKLAYNNKPLQVQNLIKLSNHLYEICSPFAKFSPGNMNRERRAQAFMGIGETENKANSIVSNDWKNLRDDLVNELEFGCNYLKRALPAHDAQYLDVTPGGLREKIASLLKTLSLQDDISVSFYILTTINYINSLIRLFNSFETIDEAQNRYEDIQKYLTLMVHSFNQLAYFLDPDQTGKRSYSRAPMSTPSGNGSGSLEALLGQLGGNS